MEEYFAVVCFIRQQRKYVAMENGALTISDNLTESCVFGNKEAAHVAAAIAEVRFKVVGARAVNVNEVLNVPVR
jgi:hypothetical protein